jgi:predicted ribosome quality control (RQC) complex YloA/Tae2 family protein
MSKITPYRIYKLSDDTEIWVGKDAKSNDLLTINFSKMEEWWCHVDEYPGSHIVIKSTEDVLSSEIMKEIAKIAVKHSKAKGNCFVTFCKCFQVEKNKKSKDGLVYLTGNVTKIKV